jgi:ABC-type transporter Mla subunit MlaD
VNVSRVVSYKKRKITIGVAQNLISELATLLSGQTFSLDALHTQTATVAAIAAAGHHCLIAVKQNQPTLSRTIESTAQTQLPSW